MASVCAFAPPCPVNQRQRKFVAIADIMSKSTSISAPKVVMDMQFFASYNTMPGAVTGAGLKFVMWTDKSQCLLELWHFPRVCFTCKSVTICYYGCILQFCLLWKLMYQSSKYGALNGLCSTLSSKSKFPYAVSCIFTCSAVLEYCTPMLWHYRGVETSL